MELLKKLQKKLEEPLPGATSHEKMAVKGRNPRFFNKKPAKGSVLIILFPEKKDLSVILIKRADYSGPHSNQVSFPGGKMEEKDKEPVHTALREAYEETGIPHQKIEVLGRLTPLYIPVSNFTVNPFVGFVDHKPAFSPDPREVQYIITVSLSELLKEETVCKNKIELPGLKTDAPGYKIKREHVWGATAMIMAEFLDVIGSIPDFSS